MQGASAAPPRREQALAYIIDRIVRDGISPTNAEIGYALDVSETRARNLVAELVDLDVLRRTPGAQRGLQLVSLQYGRNLVVELLRELGMIVVDPRHENAQPCGQEHLPVLSPFEHLPDDH